LEQEPYFLTREQIDTIHRDQIEAWGGMPGLRSEHALESAIAQPQTHLLHHVGGSYSFPAGCNFENGLVTRFLST
jgi:hypothetical protein